MYRSSFILLLSFLGCGEDEVVAEPVIPERGPDERDRLTSSEQFTFASWLVAQEGDGVVLLLPVEPVTDTQCPNVDRLSFGERWDLEAIDSPVEDPLREGGVYRMSEEAREEALLEDPYAIYEPQLEILPDEEQLPFADLPGETLYFRTAFGDHTSFDFWDPDRLNALPLDDEMMSLFIGDWQTLTRHACVGLAIPERVWGDGTEDLRQRTIARSRRIGLRYLVVDREVYGEVGLGYLEQQLEPHLAGRYEFNDGSGVTIYELYSADVVGTSVRPEIPELAELQ